jgi:hypothetical protein|tara:strand:+ start:430 stop:606 length:177 start_codon:yes stop_codon:yes gene_type:complete
MVEKRKWIKMSLPVSRPMYDALRGRAENEGQTKAGFIRSKLSDALRDEMREQRQQKKT